MIHKSLTYSRLRGRVLIRRKFKPAKPPEFDGLVPVRYAHFPTQAELEARRVVARIGQGDYEREIRL